MTESNEHVNTTPPLVTDAEYYKETREILHFESELINRRLTWLITSQSLIFAAVGATAVITKDGKAEVFRLIFVLGATMGFTISFGILLGVGAAVAEIHNIFGEFEIRARRNRPLQDTRLARRRDRRFTMFLGEFAALLLPCTFVTSWLFVVLNYASNSENRVEWTSNTFWKFIFIAGLAALVLTAVLTRSMLTGRSNITNQAPGAPKT